MSPGAALCWIGQDAGADQPLIRGARPAHGPMAPEYIQYPTLRHTARYKDGDDRHFA